MMRRLALVFLLSLVLAACTQANEEKTYTFSQFAMGTVVEYTLLAPSREVARAAMGHAHEEIERVARLLWEEDSLSQIYAVNHAAGRAALDQETYDFLHRAYGYYTVSHGAFDVTIKPVLDLYHFDAEAPTPPSASALAGRLRYVGMNRLRFVPPAAVAKSDSVAVAVGGVAKGYAVDRAVAVLQAHGIAHAIVNAGGDLYCLGLNHGKPWVVGIRHPDDPSAILDTLFLSNQAVATSGDYQRYFTYEGTRYHHLIDPATGRPARRSRSATVIAPTTEEADALATALFIAGQDAGLALLDSLPDVAGMVVDSAGVLHRSQRYEASSGRLEAALQN